MIFLLTKRVCCSNRTPDSKIRSPAFRLFGAVGTRNPVGPVATVFPEFIARDGQEPTDVGRQGEKRQGGAARRHSRGHGLARLDGTRPRATVASKVMESGETDGHGNDRRDVPTARKRSAQARSWKPGRRRQGCGRLANASPVRDERTANLEQHGPQSGDASGFNSYYSMHNYFGGKMENIFEEIDGMRLEEDERPVFGKFCDAFLGEKPVVVQRLFPLINASLTSERFQSDVMRAYTNECMNEKQAIIEELYARRGHPDALRFYGPQLDLVDKKLAIKTFQQLIDSLGVHLDEYPGSLEVLNNSYKSIHHADGAKYIKNNYVNYSIGHILYRKHQPIKGRADMLNMKFSEIVKSEYEKAGIDIEKEDSQFSKYKLISLSENIQIFNDKDSQTIQDSRLDKYFWIKVPRGLLASIESLIEQRMIAEIAFRVDYISNSVPSMEEREFGSPMKLDISSLPDLSKFYSTDNYNNNLWIQHDQGKQSLTFEELLEDFEVTAENIVTQVIHLEYISRDDEFFISHLDHEFIIYTIEQYEERMCNAGVKGYRKVKTFKVDGSMIPFNLRVNGNIFLIQVLDAYFNNRDLIQEYFAEASA
ncbi:MAG: hypothetical protein K2Y13_08640 [Burkholderiaceae bacterium]|nr:hypothetical protein [Burkholderiaceae bacterium]